MTGSFLLHQISEVRFRRHWSVVFPILAALSHLFKNSIDGTATRRSLMGLKLLSQSIQELDVHVWSDLSSCFVSGHLGFNCTEKFVHTLFFRDHPANASRLSNRF